MPGSLDAQCRARSGRRPRGIAAAGEGGTRLWKRPLATDASPLAWRQWREPWRLALRPHLGRRTVSPRFLKNPMAAQRRRGRQGPLRAAPLEESVSEPLADSIPDLQKHRSCAAAWAAFFPTRRAVRRRGPSRRRREAGFGWKAPAVMGLPWRVPMAAKECRRRHLSPPVCDGNRR